MHKDQQEKTLRAFAFVHPCRKLSASIHAGLSQVQRKRGARLTGVSHPESPVTRRTHSAGRIARPSLGRKRDLATAHRPPRAIAPDFGEKVAMTECQSGKIDRLGFLVVFKLDDLLDAS